MVQKASIQKLHDGLNNLINMTTILSIILLLFFAVQAGAVVAQLIRRLTKKKLNVKSAKVSSKSKKKKDKKKSSKKVSSKKKKTSVSKSSSKKSTTSKTSKSATSKSTNKPTSSKESSFKKPPVLSSRLQGLKESLKAANSSSKDIQKPSAESITNPSNKRADGDLKAPLSDPSQFRPGLPPVLNEIVGFPDGSKAKDQDKQAFDNKPVVISMPTTPPRDGKDDTRKVVDTPIPPPVVSSQKPADDSLMLPVNSAMMPAPPPAAAATPAVVTPAPEVLAAIPIPKVVGMSTPVAITPAPVAPIGNPVIGTTTALPQTVGITSASTPVSHPPSQGAIPPPDPTAAAANLNTHANK